MQEFSKKMSVIANDTSKYLKKFAINKNQKSAKFFRIINEIPTVLLILIIFVIIYKPL